MNSGTSYTKTNTYRYTPTTSTWTKSGDNFTTAISSTAIMVFVVTSKSTNLQFRFPSTSGYTRAYVMGSSSSTTYYNMYYNYNTISKSVNVGDVIVFIGYYPGNGSQTLTIYA